MMNASENRIFVRNFSFTVCNIALKTNNAPSSLRILLLLRYLFASACTGLLPPYFIA